MADYGTQLSWSKMNVVVRGRRDVKVVRKKALGPNKGGRLVSMSFGRESSRSQRGLLNSDILIDVQEMDAQTCSTVFSSHMSQQYSPRFSSS